MKNQGGKGFTLVELMVTVTILAVLAAVAIASYKYYIRRARLEEGRDLIQDIRMKQESYFTSYSAFIDTASNDTTFFPTKHPKTSGGADDETMWDWSELNSGCATPSTALKGWCHLGFRPKAATYFQFVTIGWNKKKTGKPSTSHTLVSNMDFKKRWYYAVGRAVFGKQEYTFLMTSQHNHIEESEKVL